MKTTMTLIAAAGLLGAMAMAQTAKPKYTVLDLGAVGGAPGQPYLIANDGLIAGASATADNKMHAIVWFLGLEFDLGTPALGGPNSAAYGVNEIGQVVGIAETTVANSEDFCGFNALGVSKSLTACLPFAWQNGVMTKLPTLGGPNGVANSINNLGEGAGWAETASRDPNAACPVLQFQPVIWEKSGVTQLKTFAGDTDGVAAAINDSGQAVGASGSCASFNANSGLFLLEKHAMLWSGGAAIDLGNLGGTGAGAGNHACAINNRGQVAGHSDLAGDATFHGFTWTWETGMRDIGTLPGDVASLGLGVGDQGITVGASLDQNFNPRAILYENGAMTDLNSVLSSNPQKLYLLLASSINARGEIVGLAANNAGELHGFLAAPAGGGNQFPAFEGVTIPGALSPEARRMVFRRLGIRGR